MSNKQIDGITKLSREEMEKSRKIVLDFVEEEMRSKKEAVPASAKEKNKLVDGLFNSVSRVKSKETPKPAVSERKEAPAEETKKPISSSRRFMDIAKAPAAKKPEIHRESKAEIEKRNQLKKIWKNEMSEVLGQESEVAPAIADEAARTKEMIEKEKKEKAERERREKEELKRNQREKEEEEDRARRAKKAAAQRAREEEEKRKQKAGEEEEKRRRNKRAEAKRDRREKIMRLRKILSGYGRYLLRSLFLAGKTALYRFLLIFLVFIFLYSVFAIMLLKFGADNAFTRYIAGYVPVPALVANGDVIEYYKYVDIKNSLKDKAADQKKLDEITRLAVIKEIIVGNLMREYGIAGTDNLTDRINGSIVFDSSKNMVALNRVMKIKKLIDSGEDFIRTATRYGDDLGPLTIDANNRYDHDYYDKLAGLETNETSEIIVDKDGYYIFHVFGKTAEKTDLSYVVVRPVLFEEYVEETVMSYHVWSLVD
ncbi:hypothetical protein A2303_07675 [Candidatus Falkowbacteria bacterium RIFOXYB2_FULL_47_14]|uniref:PpiC domain-containing protein n=1 Tax=Candidatus Falkowbacteria bacterium RIFOXYA2_FULL_47_19 TaxID=1797994 RepID=A0A1F5SMM7_9BACT|nr:MAG: hypothetical protein A2227_04820 [Candidatus Falkowbacteria bacterium RIFOXYA2_FULL_47_19]OGF36011.1 MAG: hypothetical protein A2468_00525 [Candidatus Falkowbacteria bacterium RIFOXYC2_FULL_46_15]OGF43401.1 MAG: hypothetical protein A2303_07675 [Candidatus Falkowbacteria bacterium RIFOXYB2_FULL_47_14]